MLQSPDSEGPGEAQFVPRASFETGAVPNLADPALLGPPGFEFEEHDASCGHGAVYLVG
jgi:hypothetical protein